MSKKYTPTEWVANKTVATADVMNNIEQGIVDAHQDIEILDSQIKEKVSKNSLCVNVYDYGIIGNGEDVSDEINDLINNLSNYVWDGNHESTYKNVNAIKIYFPKGVYRLTKTIDLPPYITIEGELTSQGNNYVIKETGSGVFDYTKNGTVFLCDFKDTRNFAFNVSAYHSDGLRDTDIDRVFSGHSSTLYQRLEGVTLKNFQIISGNYLFGGIYCVGAPFLTMDNINVLGSDIGMYISASWNVRVNNCGFHCKNYGVIGNNDVNNVAFDGCSIDHYYMFSGNGSPDKWYNTETLKLLYPSEGEHMPSSYVSLTTGMYFKNCWQISVSNSTIQNYERGIYCFQANTSIEKVWFEHLGIIDIQNTHSSLNIVSCRKEDSRSKFLRTTGSSVVVVSSLTGSNNKGNWVNDNNALIDYIDPNSILNFIGCPSTQSLNSSPFSVDSLKFNGYANINRVVKINYKPSTINSEVAIPYPDGFDKYNTTILSVVRHQNNTNHTFMNHFNFYLATHGIIITPITYEDLVITLMAITES